MKRVVLIRSNAVSPDPAVEKMANTLLELGYRVTILGWDRECNYKSNIKMLNFSNGKAELVLFGIKAEFGAGLRGNFKPLLLFQLRIRKWLKDNMNSIDVIHAFDFDTGFIVRKTMKPSIKLVYHILDYYIDSHGLRGFLGRTIRLLENRIIESADATVICTEKRKEQIAGCNPKRLCVIHNTPDAKIIDTSLSVKTGDDSKIKIVYVGILVGSRLLKEITEIVTNDNRFEFHVGGFGNLEKFFIDCSDRYENVYYYGKLPYDKTLALERECDIMVAIYDPRIKNNRYAAPNKFYEALMIGKPLIMAKGTGFDDIIEKNKIGCTIEFSVEGVKQGLESMLDNKDRWRKMSTIENNLYNNEYSWEIMKARINELYSNL